MINKILIFIDKNFARNMVMLTFMLVVMIIHINMDMIDFRPPQMFNAGLFFGIFYMIVIRLASEKDKSNG